MKKKGTEKERDGFSTTVESLSATDFGDMGLEIRSFVVKEVK